MKKRKLKQGLAVVMSLFMAINSASGVAPWLTFTSYAETTARVNATTLNVRSGPGTSNSIVGKLTNGTIVSVVGSTTGSDGKVWNQIRFTGNGGAQMTGYVLSSYLKAPTAYTSDMNFESYLTSQGFPESYKPGLRLLHAEYPNWVFTAQHTNLDWETVISNESIVGRNLVYSSSLSSWKSTADGAYNWDTSTWPGFDSSSYVAASEDIIRYYMDPRNFLDDKYVFQFLLHSYDPSAQTAEGLQSMVKNTFLSGSAATSGVLQTGISSGIGSTGGTSSGPGGPGVTGPGGGPGVSGSSGSSSSSASLTGPGAGSSGSSSSGNSGNSSSGASLTGPGSSSGNGNSGSSGNSSSGASLTGPGTSSSSSKGNSGSSSTSSTSGVSLTGPGTSSSGSKGNSGSSSTGSTGGVSFTAPGSSSGSGSSGGNSNSGVSLTAPGSLSSSKYDTGIQAIKGVSISKKEVTRVTTSIGPGMTAGPGGNSSLSGPGGSSSSGGPGVYGVSGGSDGSTASYVDIIMSVGAQTGVNPYVLAAMILQEQGNNGNGRSISGTVAGYTGYYNFFNIEAYQSGSMDAVSRGLWYASQSGSYGRPWNSVDRSILGGASYYATNYVNVGQDTFYLKKFNVQGSNLYKHQYMTNIQGAASEGAKLAEAYGNDLKKSALEFKIPVYQNMPATACAKPTTDGSPNNKLSGMGVDGFAITPTFNRDITSYDLIVDPSVAEVTINAVPLSSTASISGTGTVQLHSGNNEIKISVTAQNGSVREYLIHVVRQDNGPTHNSALGSGISGGSLGGGSGSSGYGPGYSSVSAGPGTQSGGPGATSDSSSGGQTSQDVTTGNGPSGSGPSSSGSFSGGPSGSGPGGSSPDPNVSSVGPGVSGGGNSYDNTGGPGGSNVTIVR